MTVDQLVNDLKRRFPTMARQIEGWRPGYEKAFGDGGLKLAEAYEACMANWRKASFPKPVDLNVKATVRSSDRDQARHKMRNFCTHDDLLDWQQRGWITRKEMIGHQYFDPDRFFGKPSSARELRMNWEEIPFTHLLDAEAEKCLPYYEQTLAENYTDVAAGILRIMIGNRAKNMRGVPA